jgi:hypothetical protein
MAAKFENFREEKEIARYIITKLKFESSSDQVRIEFGSSSNRVRIEFESSSNRVRLYSFIY